MTSNQHVTPSVARVRMLPSLLPGVAGLCIEGPRVVAGIAASVYGTTVPAADKDVFLGVRAWSPPV